MNPPMDLSVVIPVYNEEENLPELFDRCVAACRTTERAFEIVLVDDGSRDGSRAIILEAADRHSEVVGVVLNRNYGQHAAVFAGLEQSRGDIVVTLDADLQNPPEEIPKLLHEMDRGVDVVGTVRENRRETHGPSRPSRRCRYPAGRACRSAALDRSDERLRRSGDLLLFGRAGQHGPPPVAVAAPGVSGQDAQDSSGKSIRMGYTFSGNAGSRAFDRRTMPEPDRSDRKLWTEERGGARTKAAVSRRVLASR